MKTKISKTTLISFLSLLSSTAFSQQRISGKITNDKKEALAGVTVVASSSKTSIASATDGSFELDITPADKSISITSVGYLPQSVAVQAGKMYTIELKTNGALLEDVVLVGNRATQRSKYGSIVPVDVLRLSDMKFQQPQIGINELLNLTVPSFNSNRQSASDGTEHIDPASLRGLGPDQVLVLINGKRRHTTSLVNYQNTVGNGAVGTDLNAIPTSAIDRIEVLRDGASAQYGSDAIAGVINIILKKNTGLTASVSVGGASRGDGALFNASLNYGIAIAKDKGFLNATFEYNNRGTTNRTQNHNLIIFDQSSLGNYFAYDATNDAAASRAYDDAQLLTKGLKRDDFNFHVGDAKSINYQGLLNFGYKINNRSSVYATATTSLRNGQGYGFRRLPSELGNVVSAIFPNGFQPTLNSNVTDYSLIVGLKQQLGKWAMDVSNTYGQNSFAYSVKNSNNASLGNLSPTQFDAGSHSFAQNTSNIDFNRSFSDGKTMVNVATGAEYRFEQYKIKDGEEASWKLYTTNPGGAAGAQSFPGFTPENKIKAARNSVAIYADADFTFSKKLLLAAAVRFENYSDFGSTLNGKLAVRYNFVDAFALRASFSSGFRAPSLHQQYFSNFYTDISQSGTGIVNKGIFPINSVVAKAIGLPALKQENALNYSAGFTTKPAKKLTLTLDGYLIDIDNRIVITSSITDARITALGVESGRFFTNAINTRTQGIDLVATYKLLLAKNSSLDIALASNFSKTKITDFKFPVSLSNIDRKDYFGPDQESLIETNNPKSKHTLTLNYSVSKFNLLLRNIYWGEVTRNGYPFGIVQTHKAKVTTDLALTFKIKSNFSISIGGNNLLDVFPDKQAYENSYLGVFQYAPVQMGTLGSFYYARLNLTIP